MLALRNAASFYQDGKIVNVAGPGKKLYALDYFMSGNSWSSNSVLGLRERKMLTIGVQDLMATAKPYHIYPGKQSCSRYMVEVGVLHLRPSFNTKDFF